MSNSQSNSQDAQRSSDLVARPVKTYYGIRKSKTFDAWPLSIGDQETILRDVDDILQKFFADKSPEAPDGASGSGEALDIEFVSIILNTFRKNVSVLIKMTSGFDDQTVESIIRDITAKQTSAFLETVWRENFSDLLKNASGLIGKVMQGLAAITS